jgi:hypothetical protein
MIKEGERIRGLQGDGKMMEERIILGGETFEGDSGRRVWAGISQQWLMIL